VNNCELLKDVAVVTEFYSCSHRNTAELLCTFLECVYRQTIYISMSIQLPTRPLHVHVSLQECGGSGCCSVTWKPRQLPLRETTSISSYISSCGRGSSTFFFLFAMNLNITNLCDSSIMDIRSTMRMALTPGSSMLWADLHLLNFSFRFTGCKSRNFQRGMYVFWCHSFFC